MRYWWRACQTGGSRSTITEEFVRWVSLSWLCYWLSFWQLVISSHCGQSTLNDALTRCSLTYLLTYWLRPMSHLQFSRAILSRYKIVSVTWRVARVFNSRATVFPNRALLYSVQLCWQNAERWLVSCHRCFCFASVRCAYSSFCWIHFNLFNLFNLEIEWSKAKTLQLIELYEKRPYVCDKVAACNWAIAAHATLSRDFVAHSHDKIARKNCRCDIGLTCCCRYLLLYLYL